MYVRVSIDCMPFIGRTYHTIYTAAVSPVLNDYCTCSYGMHCVVLLNVFVCNSPSWVVVCFSQFYVFVYSRESLTSCIYGKFDIGSVISSILIKTERLC